MSNFAYHRAKREQTSEPLTVTIDDETFTLAPRIGTAVLEALARQERGQLAGLFDALRHLVPDPEEYERFVALDLDSEELRDVIQGIVTLYDGSGKASSSSTSSNGAGPSSTPTSSGSTGSTSRPAGSARKQARAASSD